MAVKNENRCPVCRHEVEDMRHVSVECFYDVSEVAPGAEKTPFFSEAEEGPTYWGVTRRYPSGTRDKRRAVDCGKTEGGTPITQIEIDQEPIGPIRLLEKQSYTVRCCKACRGQFLRLFGEWARGEHLAEPDPADAEIFIRENGHTRGITEEEWIKRNMGREPVRLKRE